MAERGEKRERERERKRSVQSRSVEWVTAMRCVGRGEERRRWVRKERGRRRGALGRERGDGEREREGQRWLKKRDELFVFVPPLLFVFVLVCSLDDPF